MKRALVLITVCIGLVACGEKIEPLKPLQKGTPNTLTLSTGDVVYDISGEWDAIIDYGGFGGDVKDIIKIKQESNIFVGTVSKGDDYLDKDDELLKGELERNGFKSITRNVPGLGWVPSSGKIDESCNKIFVKSGDTGNTYSVALTRK
jgi:hypothetical protein